MIYVNENDKVITFNDLGQKLDKLYEWDLIPKTHKDKILSAKIELKKFKYYFAGNKDYTECDVIGFIPYPKNNGETAVVSVNSDLCKIMPLYLKDMQSPNFGNELYENESTDYLKEEIFDNLDFVSIDFETANNRNNSACSIGLVAVKNMEIIEKKYYLIQPPTLTFDKINIEINGITPEDVKDKPTFLNIWNEIKGYFYNIIIAHNAQFDMSVLKCLQLEYNLNIPDFKYMDSISISTKACDGDVKNSLEARANALNVVLNNHHNALDDAMTCANIVIESIRKCKKQSFQKFINAYSSISVRQFSELKHQEYFRKPVPINNYNNIKISDIVANCDLADCNHLFYGKNIVITGNFHKYDRKEVLQLIANLGGILKSSVSRNTDYLIVGQQDITLVGDDGLSSKQEKAYKLIEDGYDIKIINEDKFYDLVVEYAY